MKLIVMALIVLAGQYAVANVFSKRIDLSVNNLGTSFTSSFPQKVISGVRNPSAVFINNRTTSSEVALNCSTDSTVPNNSGIGADGFDHNIYVNGGETYSFSAPGVTSACYLRSMTGAPLTSGIIVLNVTGG